MKRLFALILVSLMTLTATPAFAKKSHKPQGKGVKIGKHFSKHRADKLRKWQVGEIKRKKARKFNQYFSAKNNR